jgi:arsenical pump membrane protein
MPWGGGVGSGSDYCRCTIWTIAAAAIAGVLFRPKGWPEAVWACLGAALMVLCGLLSLPRAWAAVGKGMDVYLFLTGMMLLAELARKEGVFDWLASLAVTAARGSRTRVFSLVYVVGIVVTVLLSNDATAVVLTPAVYAAVKRARAEALPYLLICAFIAKTASRVLRVSEAVGLSIREGWRAFLAAWTSSSEAQLHSIWALAAHLTRDGLARVLLCHQSKER